MHARNYIAQIHIEKQHAGLGEDEYRQLLYDVAGVKSSKALNENQVDAVIDAIKAEGEQREGWKSRQLARWNQYLGFCNLKKEKGNELLYKITGLMSSEAPGLGQQDFDAAMAEIESYLEEKISSAEVAMPGGIDLHFWRQRNPCGFANRREVRKIRLLWSELCEYLPEAERNEDYLYGFCAHTLRLNKAKPLLALLESESHKVIEAMKLRIAQEKAKLAKEVPF
jgi:hypothetical protein